MILNKEQPIEFIDIILNEVKNAMETTCKSALILDDKAHNIIKISISIIFGLCGILFISHNNINNLIIPSIIIMVANVISLFMLAKSYKASQYYLFGDEMIDINQEDNYYHDCIGIKIYLIQQYQNKINGNSEFNKIKGNRINNAIYTIIFSGIISLPVYLFIENFTSIKGFLYQLVLVVF